MSRRARCNACRHRVDDHDAFGCAVDGCECDLAHGRNPDDALARRHGFANAAALCDAEVLPPVDAGEVLAAYPSLWCPDCGSRFFDDRTCCRRPLVAVTVTITRREVP